jgi:ATP-dependent DNA helicase RecG
MLKAMRLNGSPPPVFETDRNRTYFLVRLPLHPAFIKETQERKSQASRQVTGQVTGQVAIQVLRFCEQPRKASEIQTLVGVKHRQTFRENYLNALIAKSWFERTISDKPKSRLQRYRTTEEGKKWAQECSAPCPVA